MVADAHGPSREPTLDLRRCEAIPAPHCVDYLQQGGILREPQAARSGVAQGSCPRRGVAQRLVLLEVGDCCREQFVEFGRQCTRIDIESHGQSLKAHLSEI